MTIGCALVKTSSGTRRLVWKYDPSRGRFETVPGASELKLRIAVLQHDESAFRAGQLDRGVNYQSQYVVQQGD